MELLWLLLVGLIAGWLAGIIMKGGYGLVGDMIVGVVGAFIGGWLLPQLGVGIPGGFIGSVVVALIGAIILVFVLRFFHRGSKRG